MQLPRPPLRKLSWRLLLFRGKLCMLKRAAKAKCQKIQFVRKKVSQGVKDRRQNMPSHNVWFCWPQTKSSLSSWPFGATGNFSEKHSCWSLAFVTNSSLYSYAGHVVNDLTGTKWKITTQQRNENAQLILLGKLYNGLNNDQNCKRHSLCSHTNETKRFCAMHEPTGACERRQSKSFRVA